MRKRQKTVGISLARTFLTKYSAGPPALLTIIDPVESLLLDVKDMDDFDDEVELRSSLIAK